MTERETPITDRCKAWRSVLPVNPACEIVPCYSDKELIDLGRNIKENGGMKVPVIVLMQPDGTHSLLDGRSRLDALVHVGIKFEIKVIDGHVVIDAPGYDIPSPIEIVPDANFNPIAFALSINLRRRHVTNEVKRVIIKKVIEAQPNLTDNAIAKMAGVSDKTVNSVRKELNGNSEFRISDRIEVTGRKARGCKPGRVTTMAPKSVEAVASGKTGSDELSIEQHRARMAALTAESEPDSPGDKPESITASTISPKTESIAPKTKPSVTPNDSFNVAEILTAARKVQEVLYRPVSGPNNEAAKKAIKRVIDLLLVHKTLKPTAGTPARAA
jgi:hypothetical protein